MRIDCPRCNCSDVARRHRRGVLDNLRAYFDRWPYRCRNCETCFYARQRYPQRNAGQDERMREPAVGGERPAGPQMAYRSDPLRPTAKIVLEADNYAQMDAILLALNRAVSLYQQPAQQRETAGTR